MRENVDVHAVGSDRRKAGKVITYIILTVTERGPVMRLISRVSIRIGFPPPWLSYRNKVVETIVIESDGPSQSVDDAGDVSPGVIIDADVISVRILDL